MDPLGAGAGPFLKCHEERGQPLGLRGESDLWSPAATEELVFEAEGTGVQDDDAESSVRSKLFGKDIHSGAWSRLTTHRLLWKSSAAGAWLALRLDAIVSLEATGGVFRQRRCKLAFQAGITVAIRCSDPSRTDDLLEQLQTAIRQRGWCQGSYEAASMGGIHRVLAQRNARQQGVGQTLDVALGDLASLKQHATATVAAARQVAACTKGDEAAQGSGVQQLLDDFGLIAADGSAVAKGGSRRVDIEADVAEVCRAALEKRGGLGMLLAMMRSAW